MHAVQLPSILMKILVCSVIKSESDDDGFFNALEAIVNDNNFNNSVIRNSEEVRKVYADVLRKCLELERQVRDIVQVILSDWEE